MSDLQFEQTNKSISEIQQAIKDLKAESFDTKKEL